MIREGFLEARGLRQNWVGPEHYLLALLAVPSTAAEVMAELGVTHELLARKLGGLKTVNGRRPRYVESKRILSNSAAHEVSGWASGFAAASGRASPSSEDWLLAITYQGSGLVGSVLHELGVSPAAIAEGLTARGVEAPRFVPPEHRPWRGLRTVEVAASQWKAVLEVLERRHPSGSIWQWGFNSRRDRPGKVQFSAEEGIDLEVIVAELEHE